METCRIHLQQRIVLSNLPLEVSATDVGNFLASTGFNARIAARIAQAEEAAALAIQNQDGEAAQ